MTCELHALSLLRFIELPVAAIVNVNLNLYSILLLFHHPDSWREDKAILRRVRRARGDRPRLLLAMPALHTPHYRQRLRR